MKTLIYGAGPIGRWLALRLQEAGNDVTLLARNETYRSLNEDGVVLVDGFTNERQSAHVKLVEQLSPEDSYDLIVVAMGKSSRVAVCPVLAKNKHLKHVLFLGNDISGFQTYLDYLPKDNVLLGFPTAGGGWDGNDLIFVDSEKPGGKRSPICIGELDGVEKERTLEIRDYFEDAGLPVSLEANMDGWLKYHFAFMGPTVGLLFKHHCDLAAVAADKQGIREYVMACREAGNVLNQIGYTKRQPGIFNIYYWVPLWLAPMVFKKLFNSRHAEVGFGLHAKAIGGEFIDLMNEFNVLKQQSGLETPYLDATLANFAI